MPASASAAPAQVVMMVRAFCRGVVITGVSRRMILVLAVCRIANASTCVASVRVERVGRDHVGRSRAQFGHVQRPGSWARRAGLASRIRGSAVRVLSTD